MRIDLPRVVSILNLTLRVVDDLSRPLIIASNIITRCPGRVLLDLSLVSEPRERIVLEVTMLRVLCNMNQIVERIVFVTRRLRRSAHVSKTPRQIGFIQPRYPAQCVSDLT